MPPIPNVNKILIGTTRYFMTIYKQCHLKNKILNPKVPWDQKLVNYNLGSLCEEFLFFLKKNFGSNELQWCLPYYISPKSIVSILPPFLHPQKYIVALQMICRFPTCEKKPKNVQLTAIFSLPSPTNCV